MNHNPEVNLNSDRRIEMNSCGNCLCCMNKEFNPFCFEKNRIVELDSKPCIEYERN